MGTKRVHLLKKYPKTIGLFIVSFIISSLMIVNLPSNVRIAETAVDIPFIREASEREKNIGPTIVYEALNPKSIRVVLERIYLDGEISEEIVDETILSMEDFWAEYSDWELVDQDETQVVFMQRIDDISPLLKINGYFGITDKGTLTIYEGKPSDAKIIQSFFQINTKELKSHQQKELQKGIPVLSRDRYKEVLKMYKKYAKQEM
ncbi:hypothetical protein BKP37_04910 [Anaerobacillus alkalilacustris]|uniref:Bypass-of-forespore protein C n=1 Tax=Anaerobacillus alkalilacustris TaxID=393763 RepID=A0A1S2LVP6_9BACI|nr:intercompartmental signaling factor BofC [Anaerobacillus alkalilacustris]OIJ16579.1 hypothetical protein BKP37_04910 [Anaerobacillus alkalilacustris]